MRANMQPSGVSLDELLNSRSRILACNFAENTRKSYAYDWKDFTAWCAAAALPDVPASADTVSLYLTDLLGRRKISTAWRRLTSITYYHRDAGLASPITPAVRSLLEAAQRQRREQPRQKAAVTLEHLRAVCARAGDRPMEIRNRAMILVGFASALRRCNVARLDLQDVRLVERGALFAVRWEKQDQAAKGRIVAVPYGVHELTCPVRALKRWIELRGAAPGPLFTHVEGRRIVIRGLHPATLGRVVQRALQEIGLPAREFGAHSLRAGFVTTAAEHGVNHFVIAQQTGHRSLRSIWRYLRRADPFQGNPCAAIGL
jgi:integrase